LISAIAPRRATFLKFYQIKCGDVACIPLLLNMKKAKEVFESNQYEKNYSQKYLAVTNDKLPTKYIA